MLASVPYSSSEDESGELAKVAGVYQAPIYLCTPPTQFYAHCLLFSLVEKRSNAMVTSRLALSALRRDPNVLGYRRKTERR
jgi:hypothetical protein